MLTEDRIESALDRAEDVLKVLRRHPVITTSAIVMLSMSVFMACSNSGGSSTTVILDNVAGTHASETPAVGESHAALVSPTPTFLRGPIANHAENASVKSEEKALLEPEPQVSDSTVGISSDENHDDASGVESSTIDPGEEETQGNDAENTNFQKDAANTETEDHGDENHNDASEVESSTIDPEEAEAKGNDAENANIQKDVANPETEDHGGENHNDASEVESSTVGPEEAETKGNDAGNTNVQKDAETEDHGEEIHNGVSDVESSTVGPEEAEAKGNDAEIANIPKHPEDTETEYDVAENANNQKEPSSESSISLSDNAVKNEALGKPREADIEENDIGNGDMQKEFSNENPGSNFDDAAEKNSDTMIGDSNGSEKSNNQEEPPVKTSESGTNDARKIDFEDGGDNFNDTGKLSTQEGQRAKTFESVASDNIEEATEERNANIIENNSTAIKKSVGDYLGEVDIKSKVENRNENESETAPKTVHEVTKNPNTNENAKTQVSVEIVSNVVPDALIINGTGAPSKTISETLSTAIPETTPKLASRTPPQVLSQNAAVAMQNSTPGITSMAAALNTLGSEMASAPPTQAPAVTSSTQMGVVTTQPTSPKPTVPLPASTDKTTNQPLVTTSLARMDVATAQPMSSDLALASLARINTSTIPPPVVASLSGLVVANATGTDRGTTFLPLTSVAEMEVATTKGMLPELTIPSTTYPVVSFDSVDPGKTQVESVAAQIGSSEPAVGSLANKSSEAGVA